MPKSVGEMMEEANAVVPRIAPAQAQTLIAKGDTLVIDVREASELEQSGKIAGAINMSRGTLELRADPYSTNRDPRFAMDKTLIVYCASGGRSALAGKMLKDMGYQKVYNLGGFKDWAAAGGAVERGP